MKRFAPGVCVIAMLLVGSLYAQDIAGDWQGTLKAGTGLRIILRLSPGADGVWKATLYSIDQGPDGMPATSITFDKPTLKFSVNPIHGSYEGKLSAEGNTITGTWTQGPPHPLDFQRATKETAWQIDASPHTIQFMTVDKNVKLEILDWGGTGRPLVLLAGLGNTAHVFDQFAPKLTSKYHVYGITRRGFGASSSPVPDVQNYSSDRLGDDVLAVDDALKLNRPILVGHSIAGEELSSIGSRHPDKVSGLIYLDAGYGYAFYDRSRGNLLLDSIDLRTKLEQLLPSAGVSDRKQLVQDLLTNLPQLENDLREELKNLQAMPPPPPNQTHPPFESAAKAILEGQHKYTDIHVSCLAIFAVPHDPNSFPPMSPEMLAAAKARDLESTSAQAKAFESGVPSARVVRLPNASHFVFRSNETDVLREMNTFIASLPSIQ
jgi:non-heme chloroperoxidase